MTRSIIYALAMIMLVATLHSCNISDAENEYPDGTASVRVVNIAPLSTSAITYVHNDETVFTGIQFGDITDYADVGVGRNPDGFFNADGDTMIARVDIRDMENDMRFFDFERSFTVFALHGPASTDNVRIRSMEIEPVPNAEGNARVRVLHAASAAGPVDIYFSAPGAGVDEDDLFANGIGFNNEGGSSTPPNNSAPAEMPLYTNVTPGTYNVQLTGPGDSDVIFSEEVQIESSRNYTVVIYPTSDNDGVERLLLLADN